MSQNDEVLTTNPAREELMALLNGLLPPPNFRVILGVDKYTEKLVLRVLKRDIWVSKFWGIRFARRIQHWRTPSASSGV